MRVAAAWLLAAMFFASAPAPALQLGAQPVTAALWTEHDGIAPGRPFTLGLRLLHAPGWHTYWTVPGDAGLPTRLTWRLPAGVRAGPIQWPVPHRLPVGPLVDFGYEGDTLLLVELQAAPDLPPSGDVRLEARAQWLMCRDVCIPGAADLVLALPVREPAALHASANAAAFERARALIPRDLKLPAARAARSGARIALTFAPPPGGAPRHLEFFALEPGRIEPSAPQTLGVDAGRVVLELQAAQPVGADFHALHGVLAADGGPAAGGWFGTIEVPLDPPP